MNVTCGSLPEGASAARGTVWVSVRDATNRLELAGAAYTIVPPLPAPTGIVAYAQRTNIGVEWDRVPEAGPVPEFADCPCPLYLRRWRVVGTEAWTTRITQDRNSNSGQTRAGSGHDPLREGTTYEFQIATLRHAIERETLDALNWSATVTATTVAPPTGVRATATHDSITVTWDPQPAAKSFSVSVWGPDGSMVQSFKPDGDTPHQVIFRHLPPETEYTARVVADIGYDSPRTETKVSTTAPPANWTPLPRGPQNLRTTVTHNSVTVDWDAPYAGAEDAYQVWIFHTGADREPTAQDRKEYILLEGAGITEHTFTGLARATTYVVYVEHPSIVSETVRVAVTTLAVPAPRAKRAVTCFEYLVGATICA